MGIYVDANGKKNIASIFANVNGAKKEIVSAWVNKDGVPTKVFGKNTWLGSRFVAVGDSSAYSFDGTLWTPMSPTLFPGTNSSNNKYANSVCYGNDRLVCVGYQGLAYYSLDGKRWKKMTGLHANYSYSSVCYGNGVFVTVSTGGEAPYYSVDGETWVKSNLSNSYMLYSVCYGNGKFICVGASKKAYSSTDGKTWVSCNTGLGPSSYNMYVRGVCYGNGRFVAVGSSGYSYYSTSGVSWTQMTGSAGDISHVCYGNGRFVAVSTNNRAYYSTNGTTWTAMTGFSSLSSWPNEVCYGDGKFMCINNGYIQQSTDGEAWTKTETGDLLYGTGICYAEQSAA